MRPADQAPRRRLARRSREASPWIRPPTVRLRGLKLWLAVGGGVFAVLIIAALLIWRDDILEALLDPKVPFAVYRPPPPPDYAKASAWALICRRSAAAADPAADVFFVHPPPSTAARTGTGRSVTRRSAALLARVMLPNYAAPFAAAGRVFAPRYRQASLYTSLTLFDDAIEARQFAYGDVRAAFAISATT